MSHDLPLPQFGSFHQTALTRTELQALTWAHLGVERTAEGLRTLLDRLDDGAHKHAAHDDGSTGDLTNDEEFNADHSVPGIKPLETANLALIAEHMARHALAREHSLGAHTRTDTAADDRTDTRADVRTATALTSPTALLQEATAC